MENECLVPGRVEVEVLVDGRNGDRALSLSDTPVLDPTWLHPGTNRTRESRPPDLLSPEQRVITVRQNSVTS